MPNPQDPEALIQAFEAKDPKKGKALRDAWNGLQEQLESSESARAHAERELQRSAKRMAKVEKEVEESMAICAHDLKSPINSVISFIEILNMEGNRLGQREIKNVYERLNRTGRHMRDMIDDLLDTSTMTAGKVELDLQPQLLSNLCRDAIDHASGAIQDKEIEIDLQVKAPELKVKMDSAKGLQILSNLLSNSLKFTPRGGKVTFHVSSANKRTTLRIQDTGQGIPSDELDAIFEKFKQTSTRSTEGEKGAGLGLSIVQQLVTLHQGTVQVESQVGKGTTFELVFPVAESPVLLKIFSGKT
jgi:signal transduction histidine kinase